MKHARLRIAPDHPAFNGHFPGRPILPGVALLAEMIELFLRDADAARALGPLPQLGSVKFLRPCEPGAELLVRWQLLSTRLQFEAVPIGTNGIDTPAATGHFEVTP